MIVYIIIATIVTSILIGLTKASNPNDEALYLGCVTAGVVWPFAIPMLLGYFFIPTLLIQIKQALKNEQENHNE